jgi:soluble lytic murein transglycosylase-like protein
MFNVLHRLVGPVRALIIPMLLSGTIWAQGSQPVPESVQAQDVFAGWHAALSDAADRVLAAAVADKPWMKTPEAPVGPAVTASTTAIDPLVRIRAAIQRVQQLRPTIEPILRQEGVPSELSAIVLVESGGQPTALSPKGARGLWQFVPDTARRYGLVVTAARDERIEAVKSTRAAARYLRDLHQQFGDWQLAFAAYNAGEQAVKQAAARTGQHSFSSIQRALPKETRNYVPAVLNAVAILGGNPEKALRAVNSSRSPNARLLYASAEAAE